MKATKATMTTTTKTTTMPKKKKKLPKVEKATASAAPTLAAEVRSNNDVEGLAPLKTTAFQNDKQR